MAFTGNAAVGATGQPTPLVFRLLDALGITYERTLDGVVNATQREFFQRTADGGRKERWELEEVGAAHRDAVMPLLDELGMLREVRPTEERYTHALWLGALLPRVRSRLAHLILLWEQGARFDNLVILSGARPLDLKDKESHPHLLDYSNLDLPIPRTWWPVKPLSPTTEADMMELVFDQAPLPDGMDRRPVIVNVPMQPNPKGGALLRPTTEDTIRFWLAMHPTPGPCLAISNGPHILSQHEQLATHLPPGFTLETVGPAAALDKQLAFYLGELARLLFQTRTNWNTARLG